MTNRRFRQARLEAGLTQQDVARLVNEHLRRQTDAQGPLTDNTVYRWESGRRKFPHPHHRAALRAIFDTADDRDLGFYPRTAPTATVGNDTDPGSEGDGDVNRKEFLGGLAALAAAGSLPAPAAEAVERTQLPSGPRQVGRRDLDQVNSAVDTFGAWQDRRGGGDCLVPLAAQVAWSTALLHSPGAAQIKRTLASRVGLLANIAGWGAFDAGEHARAETYFGQALDCANHVQDWGLRANIFSDRARKACYLGKFPDALRLIEQAQHRQEQLPARAQAMLEVVRSRALAGLHQAAEVHDSVHRAEDKLANADSAGADPTWIAYFDSAELQADAGKALLTIALHGAEVDEARHRLSRSLRELPDDPDHARARGLVLGQWAQLELTVGDPRHGVELGHHTLATDRNLRSHRAAVDLRALREAVQPHRATIPEARTLSRELASIS